MASADAPEPALAGAREACAGVVALMLLVALATLPGWLRARRAVVWLRRAAAQGFPPAKLTLGLWHYTGELRR